MIVRSKQLLTDMRQRLFIELLFFLAHEVELKKVISEHDKDGFVDTHGKSAGGKMSQVAEALELIFFKKNFICDLRQPSGCLKITDYRSL